MQSQQTTKAVETVSDLGALGAIGAALMDLVEPIAAVVGLGYLIFRFYVEIYKFRKEKKKDGDTTQGS